MNNVNASGQNDDVNNVILQELRALSGRMNDLEAKVNNKDSSSVKSPASTRSSRSVAEEEDLIFPSMANLKSSASIQREVDTRLQELSTHSDKGKFKSQRGGSETVWVKKEIQWPQNHILSGSNKGRPSYDSLSLCQWVAGFASIIRDESDSTTKDQMLEYLGDIMEDCHDFGWPASKAAHAVLLCKMEESKIDWSQTDKIDKIRRVHAQKVVHPSNQVRLSISKRQMPCKYYQKSSCSHKGDHETNGQMYLHLCSYCHTLGKANSHPAKDCRKAMSAAKNK